MRALEIHDVARACLMNRVPFSSPEPTILLAGGRNRELWEQPFRACAIDEDLIKPDVGYFFCYFKMVAPTGLKVSP